jgi:hypothetical protein
VAGKIVGGYEVPEDGVELSVRVVLTALDGCVFDGAFIRSTSSFVQGCLILVS